MSEFTKTETQNDVLRAKFSGPAPEGQSYVVFNY